MSTYVTKQGDMWDSIAYSQLGSSDYTGDLINANTKYTKYFIFPAGVELTIPDIDDDSDADLPPWKTGGDTE